MKPILIFIAIAFIFLSPVCKKEMQLPDPELKKIFGKWEWLESSGGFAGAILTPASEGYAIRIEFSSDGVCQKYTNDSLTERKKFSFSQEKSIHSGKQGWVISFSEDQAPLNASSPAMAVTFSGQDTLLLNEQAYDSFGHIYSRIK